MLAIATSTALAQTPIPVANYNFSSPADLYGDITSCSPVDCYAAFTNSVPGWTVDPSAALSVNAGVWAPDQPYFDLAQSGVQYDIGGTERVGVAQYGTVLSQNVGTVLAGYTYTLNVKIGDLPGSSPGGANLQVGNNTPYFATGAAPNPGEFSTFAASFYGTSSLAGDPITINLTSLPSYYSSGQFMDVTLTQTLPEGGSSWLYLLLASATSLGAIFHNQLATRA
jgi:hypothetical protein